MSSVQIKQVDAFTNQPFGGNPAGVVTAAASLNDAFMQKIAREMNLSETAFVSPSSVADFKVRFFTPRAEVDLCGHATIATFATLHEEGQLDANRALFHQETRAGVLPVERVQRDGRTVFMMTQPNPRFESLNLDTRQAAKLLGLQASDLLDVPVMRVHTGIWWMVFGVKSLEKLANARPDLSAIEAISRQQQVIGLTPFTLETLDASFHYHIRAIAPLVGIAEDPVCGTGNGSVSTYLLHHGLISGGQATDLKGEEGQEVERPGCVYIHLEQDSGEITRVKIGGSAVTVLQGEMRY